MIFSINVHENVPFLLKQLDNIQEHVAEKHWIILSCNEYMHNALKTVTLPRNVIVNPHIINKTVFHGSLMHGIYSNLLLAMSNFTFSYFIILSSRTFFYNKLTTSVLDELQPRCTDLGFYRHLTIHTNRVYTEWTWRYFMYSELLKYFMKKNLNFHSCPHEGLVFHYEVCRTMIQFLENHPDIKDNLILFYGCVEEFALQTIAMNVRNLHHTYVGYSYIGTGIKTWTEPPNDPKAFVYKIARR
jgi:hypothetical protein